jgi:alpha-N-arabinofuranosidase
VNVQLVVNADAATAPVSPYLHGLFIEDINRAVDGGLNANLVVNHSFEGIYVERGTTPFVPDGEPEPPTGTVVLTPAGRLIDRARHWAVAGGPLEVSGVAQSHFARVSSTGSTTLENGGYAGGRGMGFAGPLRFSAWVRADDFDGALAVRLIDRTGSRLGSVRVELGGTGWQRVGALVDPGPLDRPTLGALQLELRGHGVLDLDEVSLVPDDHWGAGDPRWSQGTLRRDLIEALRGLAPRFIRFPGGCVVEGCGDGDHYRWKDTIGPLEARRPESNMWGQLLADGDYSQSNQIGFYEYFLLCEDLGAEPMPVVWAGMACQVRSASLVPLHGEAFDAVVQDAIDLIDWATGDPASNEWAALRAAAGHSEPFPLRLLAIGNENVGPDYLARFDRIRAAVEEHRPGLGIVMSTFGPDSDETDEVWRRGREIGSSIAVDEHFYYGDEWMMEAAGRYDDYPRGTARVAICEWSAYPPNVIGVDRVPRSTVVLGDDEEVSAQAPNSWASALAEAAFLTGIERNSDVVSFAAYAPLLNLVGHGQWAQNLIDFSPTAVGPTVNYAVQQLFSTAVGDRIVPLETPLPRRFFASATRDDEVVHVKLVNARDEPVEVELQIGGAADGLASGTLLQAPLTARNELAFDGGPPAVAVHPQPLAVPVVGGRAALRLEPAAVASLSLRLVPGPSRSGHLGG